MRWWDLLLVCYAIAITWLFISNDIAYAGHSKRQIDANERLARELRWTQQELADSQSRAKVRSPYPIAEMPTRLRRDDNLSGTIFTPSRG